MAARRAILFVIPQHIQPAVLKTVSKLSTAFDFYTGTSVADFAPHASAIQGREYVLVTCADRATVTGVVEQAQAADAKCVWVHSFMAGVEPLQTDTVKNLKVPVTNAKGVFSSSLAEYTLFGCGYFNKQCVRLQQNKKDKKWDQFTMGELKGKQMGIIGFGDIGSAVAKLALAYGIKVWGSKRTPGAVEGVQIIDSNQETRAALLAETDFLVAALPGTPSTLKSINAVDFNNLKPGAIFVNIGRGTTVDEEALIDALSSKKLGGAVLDVMAVEPLPESSPLWTLDNVLLSPHNADRTEGYWLETIERFAELAEGNFLEGKEFPYLVNLELGY